MRRAPGQSIRVAWMSITHSASMTTAAINPARKPGASPDARASALAGVSEFIRKYALRLFPISAAALIPCFWHRRIEAGDLGSHLYNAWLVQLIEHGQAPGLYVARMWTNVLFDHLLSALAGAFGFWAAEKIAVSIAALIFFWGAFTLVAAATRRAPWYILPLIAMFTYGWTFELGFFNYYLSLGISFFSLALLWRGAGWERAVALALTPLIWMAHPLGVVWLFGAGGCVLLAEILPRRYQILILAAAIAGIILARYYLAHHFILDQEEVSLAFSNGADQLDLFSDRYYILENVLLYFGVFALTVDVIRRRREPGLWATYSTPLALYFLVELSVLLLPDGIRFPNRPAALALLTARLTLLSAVLICCIWGTVRPQKWHLAGLTAIAAVFFTLLYRDTGSVNKMEAQVEHLIGTLPPNQRVMATILPPPESRVLIQHILDRACIGRCFSYGNYEPASEVFRVRARPGNLYVLSNFDDIGAMEDGDYTVRAEDLPAYQVYQCSLKGPDLCIRPLAEDEDNDQLGIHPKK